MVTFALDWNVLVSTALGTILGAAISAAIAWAIFSGQRVDRYQERVTDAYVRLLEEISQRQALLIEHITALARKGVSADKKTGSEPDQSALMSSLQLAIMVARGEDAVLIDVVRQRLGDTLHFSPKEEIETLGNMSVGISQYRAGLWSLKKSIDRLKKGRQIDRSSYAPDEPHLKRKRRQWPNSL